MRISDWSSDVCSSVLAVFLPGGHGAMWDFPGNRLLADLIGRAFLQGLVIGAVCHGPAGLLAATKGDDSPLVQGRRVNAFTNEEERAVGLDEVVPFLLEDRLRDLGAHFENRSEEHTSELQSLMRT